MIQASWAVARAVKGNEENALAAFKEFGRSDQFPDGESLRFRILSEDQAVLRILESHPFISTPSTTGVASCTG